MTKGELRKERKAARAAGEPYDQRGDRDQGAVEWGEGPRGQAARVRWARRYDDLNGAPESEDDR